MEGGKRVICTKPWPGEEDGGGKGESMILGRKDGADDEKR